MKRPKKTKGKKTDRKFQRGERKGPRRPPGLILRKKFCRFCVDKNMKINYLDQESLRKFITERGKIIPSRFTGTCARHQRKIAKAVKRARNIAILPFVAE